MFPLVGLTSHHNAVKARRALDFNVQHSSARLSIIARDCQCADGISGGYRPLVADVTLYKTYAPENAAGQNKQIVHTHTMIDGE